MYEDLEVHRGEPARVELAVAVDPDGAVWRWRELPTLLTPRGLRSVLLFSALGTRSASLPSPVLAVPHGEGRDGRGTRPVVQGGPPPPASISFRRCSPGRQWHRPAFCVTCGRSSPNCRG